MVGKIFDGWRTCSSTSCVSDRHVFFPGENVLIVMKQKCTRSQKELSFQTSVGSIFPWFHGHLGVSQTLKPAATCPTPGGSKAAQVLLPFPKGVPWRCHVPRKVLDACHQLLFQWREESLKMRNRIDIDAWTLFPTLTCGVFVFSAVSAPSFSSSRLSS